MLGKSCVLSSDTKQLAADYVGGNSFRKLYRVHCSVVVNLPTINILFIRFFRIDNEKICGILCASKGQIPFLFATLQWHVGPSVAMKNIKQRRDDSLHDKNYNDNY